MSCERGIDVGAYLLGAMADDERADFAAHLEACDDCRTDVAWLRPAADALPLSAPVVTPPPELRDRIMAVVRSEAELLRAAGPEADRPAPRRERRRRLRVAGLALRPLPLATLACALVALALGIAALAGGGGGGAVRSVRASVSFPGASAQLRVGAGGASLRVQGVPAPPPGKVYEVWLQRGAGAPEPTGALFRVGARGDATVNVPGDLEGVSKVMVTAEPAGGSTRPTGAVVISANA